MAYYAIPDIHGNYKGIIGALDKILPEFKDGDKIIFLGDFVDRGDNGYMVLKTIKDLQNKFSSESIIAIKGNHDTMFIDWLNNPFLSISLKNDWDLKNVKSFIDTYFEMSDLALFSDGLIYDKNTLEEKSFSIATYIKKKHKDLIDWYLNLPLYYDQIAEINTLFIHAGIEEKMLGSDWKQYTSEEEMVWKYPPNYGYNPYGFNIVCGHVIVSEFWKFSPNPIYDIYKSGNHYYIDGGSPINPELNILKIEDNKFYDFNKKEEIM